MQNTTPPPNKSPPRPPRRCRMAFLHGIAIRIPGLQGLRATPAGRLGVQLRELGNGGRGVEGLGWVGLG
jgi:hypothetical protein